MGDGVLKRAIAARPDNLDAPHWAAMRNMSDPVINGELSAKSSTSTSKALEQSATTPPTDAGAAP